MSDPTCCCDMLIVFPLNETIDVSLEEIKIAEPALKYNFRGASRILLSSKGLIGAIQLLGEFPNFEDLEKTYNALHSIEEYEILM